MTEPALYVRDGDGFVGTTCTTGSWHANGQSGGAVLALLGHVLAEVPTLTPMSLSRLTVDIVRPVPVGERLHVEREVVREGKKIQLVELLVRAGDTVTTRATALRIRDRDVRAVEGMPTSTSDANPSASLPPPEELEGVEDRAGVAHRRHRHAVGDVVVVVGVPGERGPLADRCPHEVAADVGVDRRRPGRVERDAEEVHEVERQRGA